MQGHVGLGAKLGIICTFTQSVDTLRKSRKIIFGSKSFERLLPNLSGVHASLLCTI